MAAQSSDDTNKSRELVRATMAEARPDRPVDDAHVLARLQDWKLRTDRLFDFIEKALGRDFSYDRSGKQRSAEELVQRSGLKPDQVPELDILRIEKPGGTLRAVIFPRGLWIIGANGRLDLRILGPGSRQAQYFIVDRSQPLSGPEKSAWYLVDPGNRRDLRPLTAELLFELMRTRG